MPTTNWSSIPLRNLILTIINDNHGIILEDHLTKLIEKERGKISLSELNNELMNMEIQGLVHVKQTTPTKRLIETIKNDDQYMVVGEDYVQARRYPLLVLSVFNKMYSTLFYTAESDMPQDITKVTKRQLAILNYIYTNGHPSQVRSMEISQDAFAKVLKITRQALSNHLKRLRDLDLIRTGRKFIDITEEGLKIMGETRDRQDAFVFVKVKPQARNKVYDTIKKSHTTTVYRVTGDVDLIALVHREKLDDFLKKVSGINGVIKTSAHIILGQINP